MFRNKIIILVFLIVFYKVHGKALLNLNRTKRQSGDGSCTLPAQPNNGVYNIEGKSDVPIPGTSANQFSYLQYECQPKFVPNGDTTVYCIDGKWTPNVPQCLKDGKSVLNLDRTKRQSGDGSCTLPAQPNNGIYNIGGDNEVPIPGTSSYQFSYLQYECQPNFIPSGDTTVYCIDGKWTPNVPQCL